MERLIIFFIDFTAFALFALWHWLHRKFGAVTFDQLAFHLQANFGSGATSLFEFDPQLVASAIHNVVIVPVVLAVILMCLRELFLKRFRPTRRSEVARRVLLGLSLVVLAASCLLAPAMMGSAGATAKIPLAEHDLFGEHYRAPSAVEIAGGKTKNLVVIYVESLEQSYADAQAFGENRIPLLSRLQQENVAFGQYVQVANTGWTMAALVSTMCGVPLKAIGLFTQNRFGAFEKFLPKAKCLADILQEHGYRTEFLQGAAIEFAAKNRFLTQHGFALLEGKSEIEHREHIAGDDEDSWRIHDDSLMEIAKRHYKMLAAAERPFLLGVLTVDTHTEPDTRNSSRYCRREHGQSYVQLIECTDELVAGLVTWIQKHDPAHNTAIVVLGDHLVMFGNPKYNETFQILDNKHDRAPYHLFVNPAVRAPARRSARLFTHFDMFPTMLAAAGFEIPGHRLGLGTDLFSPAPTLIESYGASYVNELGLQPAAGAYLALWGF
jgi:phosphoglycerol transferase